MTDYIERTIDAYNKNPEKYVESTERMTPAKEFGRFVDAIKGDNATVLDAGCAFGRDTSAFKEAGLKPVGVDLSDGLLKEAHELHPSIDFRKMDIRRLNFPESSFDGVWCHAVLLHLNDEDIATALQELYRVLNSGGTLFLSFKKGEGTEEIVESFSSNDARFYNFKTIESLTSLLDYAGFRDIDAYDINEQKLFGPDKRNLDWVYSFSTK